MIAISVVIPTLGGRSLVKTIESLNRGSVVPDEILICIPQEEAPLAARIRVFNVVVIPTSLRGQVAQRAVGFQHAKSELVLQIDDDIDVSEFCLERLVDAIQHLNFAVAVAPMLLDRSTGQSVFSKPSKTLVRRLYYWLLNGSAGYQPGCIYKSGSGDGPDPAYSGNENSEVEWVPGGCVLHKRENLILTNYFPYSGKAFCEDFIHSFLLKQNGVKLVAVPEAAAYLEMDSYKGQSFPDFYKGTAADYRARAYFMQLSSRKSLRIYWFYAFIVGNYFLSRLRF
jgi:glycosyltransferase involved in cell wall biosynthesis